MPQLKIISDFKHILIFFKLLGHIHFHIAKNVSGRVGKCLHFLAKVYLFIFFCCYFYVQFLWALFAFAMKPSTDLNSHIFNFVDKVMFICSFLTVSVSIIKTIMSSKQQHQILANIELVDKYFESHFMAESPSWKFEMNMHVFAYILSYYFQFMILTFLFR